jgi:hypothetical protein
MSNSTFPYDHPETIEELQSIIDRGLTESIHLEFKRSEALQSDKSRVEVSKDISAFANSDGGVIIYGMAEVNHSPTALDGGVEHKKFSKERLEDLIQSNVASRLQNLRISQIQLDAEHSFFVVSVPRSDRGPHQDRANFRYYKRHNFKSSPMEDYEINDIRNRRVLLPALISVRVDVVGMLMDLVVENVGNSTASDIQLQCDPAIYWHHGEPRAFSTGIRSLLSGKKLRFRYGAGPNVLADHSPYATEFAVDVSYFHHGVQKRVGDRFEIDLASLHGTLQEMTDLQLHSDRIEAVVKKLTDEIKAIRDELSPIKNFVNPTGLALSVTSLRNLANLIDAPARIEKIDPFSCSWQTFQEVLAVDSRTAIQLTAFFRNYDKSKNLIDVHGMTPDLLAGLRRNFQMDISTDSVQS